MHESRYNEKGDIFVSITKDGWTIRPKDHLMGVAELSPMLFCATYFNPNPDPEGHWLYFNRLFVPPRLRRKGVGTELMTTVCGLADERHVHILNEINPYGDMTFEQLLTFFEKFGFIQIGSTHVVYRLHKGS